ncbi:riboflavin kinase [Candidatus Uhrbacteria bacterium]|nr:riboflavin kinase [Candidatus Uhrbacteria bacterium]
MTISGVVVKGQGLGRVLGFPTANLAFFPALPPGVYLAYVRTKEGLFPGVLAQGKKTEVHLLDFTGDLYGSKIEIEVDERISDMIPWTTLEELREKISHDIENARYVFRHRPRKGRDCEHQ